MHTVLIGYLGVGLIAAVGFALWFQKMNRQSEARERARRALAQASYQTDLAVLREAARREARAAGLYPEDPAA